MYPALPFVRQIASGNLLDRIGSSAPVLCDDLDGWDGKWGCGREAQEEGIFVYRSLILFVDQQKLTQHCKTTTPQLKTNKQTKKCLAFWLPNCHIIMVVMNTCSIHTFSEQK